MIESSRGDAGLTARIVETPGQQHASRVHGPLEPGGVAIISTAYRGYVKNLALAISGKLDNHSTALWDHGHIKFWSRRTLEILLQEAGFASVRFARAERTRRWRSP
jgi:2-polyprenyl-6-hydroxyphenyl methylase/3-demethylubiquinone-9 3-methyltransferase